ncbi:hypothetical protein ACIRL2_41700 [Embleya sp. NPDC127516]
MARYNRSVFPQALSAFGADLVDGNATSLSPWAHDLDDGDDQDAG